MTNRAAIPNPALQPLAALLGDWHTTGKHPAVPEKTLHGKASFEWIEGGAFLLMHSQLDDRFPNGIAIVGSDGAQGPFFMLYFDERGVSRNDGGRTMVGRGEIPRTAVRGQRTWISPIGESLSHGLSLDGHGY